jgi:hypothetical protein
LCAALAVPARAQTLTDDPLDLAVRIPRIAGGAVVLVGEDHPLFDLADFPLAVEGSTAAVEASWIAGSVKWVRAKDGLPLPTARLRILVRAAPERALLRWRDRAVQLQDAEGGAAVEIFVPLLEGGEARVELDGRPQARVLVATRAATATPAAARHAIDHSCSPWNVAVRGLDDAFVSMNCRLIPVGRIGAQEPYLEIRWAAAGVSLPGGDRPPFTAALRGAGPARTTVTGPDGRSRVVEISASVPPRLHLLRLAAGAGPYQLSSSAQEKSEAAGSVMIYANLRLRNEDGLSVRAFEAAVSQSPAQTAFFNNLGLYFAYDVANVWDRRLRLTALLGMQSVSFAERGLAREVYNEGVFPQGFEISYFDAFGSRNKTLSGGMFLQPVATKPYKNVWVRYGGRVFGELNYISWQSGGRSARMSGVSIGVPFAQLF